MDSVVVQQLLDFFQDFLKLCQLKTWPSNNTSEMEIKNAFLTAQHIEKCLDKLQKKDLITDFISILDTKENNANSLILSTCFADPPKYVLKKLMNSDIKISQVDVGLKVFMDIFKEEKLTDCLADLMVEAASKKTLLQNLPMIGKEKMLDFKVQLLLSKLSSCEDSKDIVLNMLTKHNDHTVELLILCLLNKDYKYDGAKTGIKNAVIEIMISKNSSYKKFWKVLLNFDEKLLIDLCVCYSDIFKIISEALLDCGKLLKEHMSMEFFYIDLNYSELVTVVRRICKNPDLKLEFMDFINGNNFDVTFWEDML